MDLIGNISYERLDNVRYYTIKISPDSQLCSPKMLKENKFILGLKSSVPMAGIVVTKALNSSSAQREIIYNFSQEKALEQIALLYIVFDTNQANHMVSQRNSP